MRSEKTAPQFFSFFLLPSFSAPSPKRWQRRLTALGTIALTCALGACQPPTPPAPPSPAQPPKDKAAALLKSGGLSADATPQEHALTKRLLELQTARDDMKGVLDELPKKKAEAEELRARMTQVESKLDKPTVKMVLNRVGQHLDRIQKGEEAPKTAQERRARSLIVRANALDSRIESLLTPPKAPQGESPNATRLRKEVLNQQEALRGMGAATTMAFRALRILLQMEVALPQLEAKAATK